MEKVDVKEKARMRELRVLQHWQQHETFKKSIEQRETAPNYVFYEGPPTANGTPHIGHVLGRVIKDFICRYKTMTGYKVVRKAGWDTHGLPVELGVEKRLGISGKQEIERYGVEQFVEACKNSVFEYEKQWRELTEAIGYWTDLDHPYVTLTNDYIESVWHILSDIHKKGLLYKGHRVSPYCPSCQTSLSSHEVAQGYEDVKDLSATVKFKNNNGEGEYFLAWTTTPWTLPANTALAVNADIEYVKVKQAGSIYIVAKNLVDEVMDGEYELLSVHKGTEFVGISYEPPFQFVTVDRGHTIIHADFVSDTSGTGIVHVAPAHGEDDYRAAQQHGIGMIHVVNAAGRYTDEVTPFAGRFVKDCDVDIVKHLAERGLLYSKERYEHSYPFCWRCNTPLLYYAMESWFIKTTAVKEQLIANNNQVDWYPAHIREGRFGKFLEELVDWNISRNRYWGTPLNVWICDACGGEYAPESHADLRARSLALIDEQFELHKPYVDEVKLRCPHCDGTMERTPEVIDVWFDSGSMPFAQYHYPFENEQRFQEQYPADMICEAIDQTRGWFYSLLAVSTLYTGKAPYKAVMSTGHILDENGRKMSKSKGNIIDPWDMIEEYGTDALRWALLSDSAPWNSKRFSHKIVAEAKSKVIDTLTNIHAFYTLYATIDQFQPEQHPNQMSDNILDRWILSRLNNTLNNVRKGLETYDFLNPAKQIEALIDEVSNWYIRRSRDRFWGSEMSVDKVCAYRTLRHVLLIVSRMIAPFAPFIADEIYMNVGDGEHSVHLSDYPNPDESAIDLELESDMQTVRRIVEMARNIRNETGIKTRQPLSELIISTDGEIDLEPFAEIIKDEINVKQIRTAHDDIGFVDVSLKMNLKVAGAKYGKHVAPLQNFLRQLPSEEAKSIVEKGGFDFETDGGEVLHVTKDELLMEKRAKQGFASMSAYEMTVTLNTDMTVELEQEGFVRELVRAVQDYRKQLDLPIDKRVDLELDADGEALEAIQSFEELLRDNVLLRSVSYGKREQMVPVSVAGVSLGIHIQ